MAKLLRLKFGPLEEVVQARLAAATLGELDAMPESHPDGPQRRRSPPVRAER